MKKNSNYELSFEHDVLKFLNKLKKKDKKSTQIILKGIQEILENPFKYESLKHSYKGYKKKRKGNYRIIFEILQDSEPINIHILKIGLRGDVYNDSRH